MLFSQNSKAQFNGTKRGIGPRLKTCGRLFRRDSHDSPVKRFVGSIVKALVFSGSVVTCLPLKSGLSGHDIVSTGLSRNPLTSRIGRFLGASFIMTYPSPAFSKALYVSAACEHTQNSGIPFHLAGRLESICKRFPPQDHLPFCKRGKAPVWGLNRDLFLCRHREKTPNLSLSCSPLYERVSALNGSMRSWPRIHEAIILSLRWSTLAAT